MSKKTKLLTGGAAILLMGCMLFLWTVDIPAPDKKISKTISNDRFKQ